MAGLGHRKVDTSGLEQQWPLQTKMGALNRFWLNAVYKVVSVGLLLVLR